MTARLKVDVKPCSPRSFTGLLDNESLCMGTAGPSMVILGNYHPVLDKYRSYHRVWARPSPCFGGKPERALYIELIIHELFHNIKELHQLYREITDILNIISVGYRILIVI
jgi:hypothetical protein